LKCPHCGKDSEVKSAARRAREYRERFVKRLERLEASVRLLELKREAAKR
jgi:hypothetical protein